MDINTLNQDGHIIVELVGSLDGNTSGVAQEKVAPLIGEKSCMIMDLSKCEYVSSAGLRMLLMVAKQLTSRGGWLTLAGLSDEIQDVMEMTGFSGFFKAYASVPEAIEALKARGA